MIDLTVVSVLLDAGRGSGLALRRGRTAASGSPAPRGSASRAWHAFSDGVFSSDPATPLRVDAAGLRRLTSTAWPTAFQVGPSESVGGLDGRVAVLHRLGDALAAQPEVFGPHGRPGGLFDVARRAARARDGRRARHPVPAADLAVA